MRRSELLVILVVTGGLVGATTSPGVAASAFGNETATYTYDALGRLTGSNISGGPNDSRATGSCFDRAGNRMRYDVATSTPGTCPTPSPTPTPSP
jgi:hypothetical protein